MLDDASAVPDHAKPSWPRALRVALVWVILWSAPILLLSYWPGSNHTVVKEGIFFSKAALVTFGGAYAVLPYVAQQAVQTHHWLSAGQMLDGLGLAETTPGPLIMVSGTGCILSFWRPRARHRWFIFSLKGCAFLYLLIHNFRLYLLRGR